MNKKKQDTRSLSAETQEELRFRAVKAINAGMKQKEAARIFGVTEQIVSRWMRAYREKGWAGLKSKKRGRRKGDGKKLKNWQSATIVKMIDDRQPDQLKLPFYLWSREAVRDLIKRKFGITFSLSHIARLLKQWGFTVQKPARQAKEQSSAEVKKWLAEEYPQIKAKAMQENGEILWGDEMGVRSDAAPAKCYSRKGKTPVIRKTGNRFGCNMISAISNRGRLHFMVFKKTFNEDIFLDFLKRLIKQITHKIFLIVDRHPVHFRSKAVKKFVDDHKDKIELAFLPGYCPELNPDEMVNNDVKTNAVRRQRAENVDQLMKNMRAYLYGRQQQPHIVMNYFKAPYVKYAA